MYLLASFCMHITHKFEIFDILPHRSALEHSSKAQEEKHLSPNDKGKQQVTNKSFAGRRGWKPTYCHRLQLPISWRRLEFF
jgi:hypothetical protein